MLWREREDWQGLVILHAYYGLRKHVKQIFEAKLDYISEKKSAEDFEKCSVIDIADILTL